MSNVQAAMLPPMQSVIQALVWISAAGLLYLAWLQSHPASAGFDLAPSFHAQRVIGSLQVLWLLVAFSLMLSLLFVGYPIAHRANTADRPGCRETGVPLVTLLDGCGENERAGASLP